MCNKCEKCKKCESLLNCNVDCLVDCNKPTEEMIKNCEKHNKICHNDHTHDNSSSDSNRNTDINTSCIETYQSDSDSSTDTNNSTDTVTSVCKNTSSCEIEFCNCAHDNDSCISTVSNISSVSTVSTISRPKKHHKKPNHHMKVKIYKEHESGLHESIVHITKTKCIILPSTIMGEDQPFVYDFKCRKGECVKVITNSITYGRITDSTDIDNENFFWFLSLESKCDISLIKAHYDICKRVISLVAKFTIPYPLCKCIKKCKCPNYEGLVQVSNDEFIIFADSTSKKTNYGVCYVSIKNHIAKTYVVKIDLKGENITNCYYDSLKISTAFKTCDGIIFVPQHPENHHNCVFKLTNRGISLLRKQIEMRRSCLIVDACIEKMFIGVEQLKECASNNNINKFMIYDGIEAMTVDNKKHLYGVSIWHIPYYVWDEETKHIAEDAHITDYVTLSEKPSGYDVRYAGVYSRMIYGKICY